MISKKDKSLSKKKGTYHIHNWREYNKALVQRGSITFWFSEESINKWYSTSFRRGVEFRTDGSFKGFIEAQYER
jgi:hypothetical protein